MTLPAALPNLLSDTTIHVYVTINEVDVDTANVMIANNYISRIVLANIAKKFCCRQQPTTPTKECYWNPK